MAQYDLEFTTELTSLSGGFDDVIEADGHFYTLGKDSTSVYYAKFAMNGDSIWAKTLDVTPNTVMGITEVDSRIFLGYAHVVDGHVPVRLMEVDTSTGLELNGITVLDSNLYNLRRYSQLRTSEAHGHLYMVAADTLVRYDTEFAPQFSFLFPPGIQHTVETADGAMLFAFGAQANNVTIVARLDEGVSPTQNLGRPNFGHSRKLVRLGENKYRVFTYDSDTLRTWMVNDTCADAGDNLFWRIWTSTNPVPDDTYEFEVTATADSSFILSFKNVILFWGSENNEGIMLIELHEHASVHQTVAKTIEDSSGEYVFVGMSEDGHPYISRLGDGLITGVETADEDASTLSVFPNPASDRVYVQGAAQNAPYQVVDASGRKVLEGTLQGQHSPVDISGLRSGVYALTVGTQSIQLIRE